MRNRDDRDEKLHGLLWGLFLVAIGVLFLLDRAGVLTGIAWGFWWAYLMIPFGVIQLFTARSPKRIGEAVTTLGFAGYFIGTVTHWWGLTWATSWPLALVAIGAGYVAQSVASMFWRRGESEVREVGHDQ